MKKLRVGILFGGPSREREVSFAGGRTVYDNLDKALFEPVPIFVDSFGNLVLLDWQYVYKGSIRDFYPPAKFIPDLPHGFQVYAESLNPADAIKHYSLEIYKNLEEEFSVSESINPYKSKHELFAEKLNDMMLRSIGTRVDFAQLHNHIDFAFLALHGTFGEDGSIQGLLEWYGIPYSGSGILPSAIGINKSIQKDLQSSAGLYVNDYHTISKSAWIGQSITEEELEQQRKEWYMYYITNFEQKMVIKPAHQGSSLGVSILKEPTFDEFCTAVDLAFFKLELNTDLFNSKSDDDQIQEIKFLTDLRSGLGLPLLANGKIIHLPNDLLNFIKQSKGIVLLESLDSESEVVVESMIEGKEFSCIVVATPDGGCLALPPTEIRKSGELFDYRSKYLPGLSHKVTPIEVAAADIEQIRQSCIDLYHHFGFEVYARIDGFITNDSEVFLNDPNTTSGMMPSSFFFHQAAEIGLNPSQFLTYILSLSIDARIKSHPKGQKWMSLQKWFNKLLEGKSNATTTKRKIAVIMGGYSFERHISMESGRNIFEKLSSSSDIEAIPIFLAGDAQKYEFFKLPLNMMLKDNADDIREKIEHYQPNPVLDEIREEALSITEKYTEQKPVFYPQKISLTELSKEVEGVFIALHGRPGEDGTLQKDLASVGLYHNGSLSHSAAVTINKYDTNKKLRELGFLVADHEMIQFSQFAENAKLLAENICNKFGLPLIAKPADDGCSAAVRKIKSAEELEDFMSLIFRKEPKLNPAICERLGISTNDEIPQKTELLIEKFIDKGNCSRFLEVTGGMLTHVTSNGDIDYEIFEPSESLAESEILSLEEKFLAGQGQNLTPSRFAKDPKEQERISAEVRKTLKEVAKALDVTGYCRIDAFVKIFEDGKVETWIIEINSLPGMTPATCIYHQAAINGYKPYDFIEEILNFGKLSQK